MSLQGPGYQPPYCDADTSETRDSDAKLLDSGLARGNSPALGAGGCSQQEGNAGL